MVQRHTVTQNRSLFQCFVDNLRYPYQIEKTKKKLHTLESPSEIKRQFAVFMETIE